MPRTTRSSSASGGRVQKAVASTRVTRRAAVAAAESVRSSVPSPPSKRVLKDSSKRRSPSASPRTNNTPPTCTQRTRETFESVDGEEMEDDTQRNTEDVSLDDIKRAKKRLLASSAPDTMLGRESEYEVVRSFWLGCLTDRHSGALYISGSPGTGKTATVESVEREVLQWEKENKRRHRIIKVNCMRLTDPKQIYTTVVAQLTGKTLSNGGDAQREMEKLFTPSKQMDPLATVILDEVDQLSSRGQDVLYRLFELPMMRNSRLVLIAIANALDLMERLLPRLQVKGCVPQCINFNPYTAAEIANIIKVRLADINTVNAADNVLVFDQVAIEYCARKVSGTSGDARKALDACKLAIDIAERQVHKSGQRRVRVSVAHMVSVFTSNEQTGAARIKGLPLHHKLILLSVAKASQTKKKEATVGQIHTLYDPMAHRVAKGAVNKDEFVDMCVQLGDQAFLTVSARPAEVWHRTVSLRFEISDVSNGCKSEPLLQQIAIEMAPGAV